MTDSTESRTDDGSVRTVERDRHRNGRRDGGHETVNELAGEELVIEYPSGDEPVVNGESIRVTPGAVTALVGSHPAGLPEDEEPLAVAGVREQQGEELPGDDEEPPVCAEIHHQGTSLIQ